MSPKLPTRKLGKNGPEVIAQGFGLMGLSAFYGATESDEDRFKILDRAFELGQTNWDSADIYLDNEDLIGKWFKRTEKRNKIFLVTKFANKGYIDSSWSIDSSPEYYREAYIKSLKRLGIKTIDLYYCHQVDQVIPIEKIVQAIVELKK
ncbi:Aldo keto reductase protein [Rutstroemia sp. NJR-2017a BBW]|nr:Aldo keto reductase protein [Rutstroemia sp. NJR-2017a BBW]